MEGDAKGLVGFQLLFSFSKGRAILVAFLLPGVAFGALFEQGCQLTCPFEVFCASAKLQLLAVW